MKVSGFIAEDGKFIGTTDLNGVLNDVKGAEVVSITHVAYQPKKYLSQSPYVTATYFEN